MFSSLECVFPPEVWVMRYLDAQILIAPTLVGCFQRREWISPHIAYTLLSTDDGSTTLCLLYSWNYCLRCVLSAITTLTALIPALQIRSSVSSVGATITGSLFAFNPASGRKDSVYCEVGYVFRLSSSSLVIFAHAQLAFFTFMNGKLSSTED